MRGEQRWFLRQLLTTALLACGVTGSSAASVSEDFTAEELARGRKIFTVHCARCHGMQGLGGTGPSLVQAQAGDFNTLLSIIAGGIPGTAMPGWRLLMKKDQRVVAGFVRTLGTASVAPLRGDPARGQQLFAKAGCVQCHAVAGQGGVTGPDLTLVGLRRGPERLRQMLLEPGAEKMTTDEGYAEFLPVRLVTASGLEIEGHRLNEDGFTIQVRDFEHRLYSFRKTEIREIKKDFSRSIMPSFAAVFSTAELDDIVAYLANLRGRK